MQLKSLPIIVGYINMLGNGHVACYEVELPFAYKRRPI